MTRRVLPGQAVGGSLPSSQPAFASRIGLVPGLGLAALIVLTLAWLIAPLPWAAPSFQHTDPWFTAGSAVRVYYQAGLDVRAGLSPYHQALAWQAVHSTTDPLDVFMEAYIYPPLLAVLYVPLTLLPAGVVAVAWELLSLACAVYVAAFLARLVLPEASGSSRWLVTGLALVALLLFGPLRHSMRGAQIDVVLLALVAGAFDLLRRGRSVPSALLLGLVVAVKPTFAILLVVHLWQRRWRPLAMTVAISGVLLLLPFLLLPRGSFHDYLATSAYVNSPGFLMAPKSVSAFGVLERLLSLSHHAWSIASAPLVVDAVELAILVAAVAAACALVPAAGAQARDSDHLLAVAVLVMVLASPLTEDAHLGVALIPLATVAGLGLRRLRGGEREAGVVLLVLAALVYAYLTLPVRGEASFATYTGLHVVWAGYWFYGTAALAALFAWATLRARPELAADSCLAKARAWLQRRADSRA